jgi:hypothetical protein
VNVACANVACSQFQYSNVSAAGFRAPNEAVNLNGSLWGIRVGARVRF